jgi:KUP system potassium uptake protein
VFLALTGGEALYADMGHFGRSAIRISWFAFVAPALVLVYLGQGALVLADSAAAENPFFLLFPSWLLAPAILLTTAATVIASVDFGFKVGLETCLEDSSVSIGTGS